jgi:hypothetical protein
MLGQVRNQGFRRFELWRDRVILPAQSSFVVVVLRPRCFEGWGGDESTQDASATTAIRATTLSSAEARWWSVG